MKLKTNLKETYNTEDRIKELKEIQKQRKLTDEEAEELAYCENEVDSRNAEQKYLNGESLDEASQGGDYIRLEKKKNEWEEFTVKDYKNGKFNEESSYYTDDWQDAVDTFKAVANRLGYTITKDEPRLKVATKQETKINEAINDMKIKTLRAWLQNRLDDIASLDDEMDAPVSANGYGKYGDCIYINPYGYIFLSDIIKLNGEVTYDLYDGSSFIDSYATVEQAKEDAKELVEPKIKKSIWSSDGDLLDDEDIDV